MLDFEALLTLDQYCKDPSARGLSEMISRMTNLRRLTMGICDKRQIEAVQHRGRSWEQLLCAPLLPNPQKTDFSKSLHFLDLRNVRCNFNEMQEFISKMPPSLHQLHFSDIALQEGHWADMFTIIRHSLASLRHVSFQNNLLESFEKSPPHVHHRWVFQSPSLDHRHIVRDLYAFLTQKATSSPIFDSLNGSGVLQWQKIRSTSLHYIAHECTTFY